MMKASLAVTVRRKLASIAFLATTLGALVPRSGAVPLHPRLGKSGAPALAEARALDEGLDRPAARTARLPDRVAVLLVEFADVQHVPAHTPAAIEAAFFGGTGSLRDYYARSSYGRLGLSGTVVPWVRLAQPLQFYAAGRGGIGGAYPRNARRLVEDAVRAADRALDFSRFDNDGPDGIPSSGDDDGTVDALVVVHAGLATETSNDPDALLSHTWFTPNPVRTADGTYVWSYALVAASSPVGVRAHEFGHLLGLPDLYDRRATSVEASGGLGDWSLMASGVWLGDGEQPGDLDAPSKVELGFVDPIVPEANAVELELAAGHGGEPPDVYQVWTYGRVTSEYLVFENRRPEPGSLDALLPGGGMLVYHVNLARATNDDPMDLRVQLLQADGRSDLEEFRNSGDWGDPYPGTGAACCRIDAASHPSTRAHDGSDSQIVISNISTPTARMRFDLQIETRACLVAAAHRLSERSGDGDGIAEAGEELELVVEIENRGMASPALAMLWNADPVHEVTWVVDTSTLAPLSKGGRTSATLLLVPGAELADPHAVRLVGEAREANGTTHALSRTVALGAGAGFQACFAPIPSSFTRDCTDVAEPWHVVALRSDAGWSLEPRSGDLASVWRSARGVRYPNGADVALVSPPFHLEPGSELHLLHSYTTQELAAGWAQDGGRVEISLHGGEWEPVEPRRGYPRRLFPESVPYLAGAGVFAGQSARRWEIFALGDESGSARLRFRFVSDDSVGASGWEIARVEVLPVGGAAIPAAALAVVAEPNPARFPTRVSFRVSASRLEPALATRLLLFDARGKLVRVLGHSPVPSQSGGFTWDGMDHAGRPVPSGVYMARLEWGGEDAATKILVLR